MRIGGTAAGFIVAVGLIALVRGRRLVRVQQQARQQPRLPAGPERTDMAVVDDLHRPENEELRLSSLRTRNTARRNAIVTGCADALEVHKHAKGERT